MSLPQSYKLFVKYATFFRFISPHNGIFWIKSLFWRRLSTCFALCWACSILGDNRRTKDEIFIFEEFTIIDIHRSAMVEEGGGADERAYHVLRLFSISLFVRLFVCLFSARVRTRGKVLQVPANEDIARVFLGLLVEKGWNIVHVNELRVFWRAFRVFCLCLDWKVMEYRACQWVAWVLACFSCVLLVFRLKSDGISCMSMSYVCFALFLVCFARI